MPVYGVPPSVYRNGGVAGPAPGTWPGTPVETAVVLAGGGNRGAVQVGMMRALVERGVIPDVFIGTSIGAINGAGFAGAPTLEGVYLAADVWRRIAASDVFPRSRFHGTWRFLDKRPSVFPIDGLRGVVAAYLRFERLEDAPVPLLLIATRLDDGAEEWFTTGSALDAIMASAALPGMYPSIEIGEHRYFDGGVLNNVGISAALATGAKRVYVLLCDRVDASAPSFSRPFEAMFAAFSLALGARVRRDLASVPSDVDVIVIEQPGSAIFDPQDFSKTDDLIEQGYLAAREVLDEYERARRVAGGGSGGSSERERDLVARLRRVGAARRRDHPLPNAASRADEVPPGSTR
ncbi:MAG: patatin-like phospholipase family protein [Acidimicrobiales bacterium]|jgi:NTE family protein